VPYPAQIDAESIGAVGLHVVESVGWQGWSLRDVAKELGVTPNAIYRHVEGRHGLLVEIGGHAARELMVALTKRELPADPVQALVEIAARYVAFAAERAHAYQAFTEAKPAIEHPLVVEWFAVWDFVRTVVAEAVPHSVDAAGFALWALLHGRISLAAGPAQMVSASAGMADAVQALVAGFAAGDPVPSPLPTNLQ